MGDVAKAPGRARGSELFGEMSSELLRLVFFTLAPEDVSNAAMVSRQWNVVGT